MRRMARVVGMPAMLAILAVPLVAQDVTVWTVDPAHSTATFSVRHMMVSTIRGQFGKTSGEISINEKDIAQSTVDITIDATSIDTQNERRDNDIRSANFLDVANHPTMTFKSKKITKAANGILQMTGDLTIRGVTKEVTFTVDGPTAPVTAGRGGRKRGASATTKINRKDFGVAYNSLMEGGGLVVGDELTVTVDLELNEKRAPAAGQ